MNSTICDAMFGQIGFSVSTLIVIEQLTVKHSEIDFEVNPDES